MMFSTSSPTYPASVSEVASAMVKGTLRKRASDWASSVLPDPVGPMVDLDGLKQINDRLGHAAGNRAIQGLADAVREELRGPVFAARSAGEEFVVLLPQTSEAQGALFPERLRRRLLAVSEHAGLPVRGSIGVAAVSGEELASPDAAEGLMRRAGEALYRANRSARDRVEVAHIPQ